MDPHDLVDDEGSQRRFVVGRRRYRVVFERHALRAVPAKTFPLLDAARE